MNTTDMDSMERATRETVERAHRAYMVAALWSSSDDNGEPLDATHDTDDIAPEAREQMLEDVAGFLSACWGDTWEGFALDLSALEPEQIGHDLWLTRNGHGAGFWDRGLGELGDRLTDLAHSLGSSDLYVADDGSLGVQTDRHTTGHERGDVPYCGACRSADRDAHDSRWCR